MNPANLPPAVVAQALQVIQPLLPPPQVQSSLTQASAQVLSQQGRLNLLPKPYRPEELAVRIRSIMDSADVVAG